jgi:hypothetical protein
MLINQLYQATKPHAETDNHKWINVQCNDHAPEHYFSILPNSTSEYSDARVKGKSFPVPRVIKKNSVA